MSQLHFCINTHNNLNYLKLAVESVRENAFHNDAPFHIYAENCTDGTEEWLNEFKDEHGLDIIIEHNETPVGIGGGMNILADRVENSRDVICFLHSDMYVSQDFDLPLVNYLRTHENQPMLVSSHRIEPNIFGQMPKNSNNEGIWNERYGTLIAEKRVFGYTHKNFKEDLFLEYADQFTNMNGRQTIQKGEGAGGFMIRKCDWDYIGGNDPIFAPASYEDMDLFVRMQNEGYKFPLLYDSLIWHFAARGSHFPDDNFDQHSERQIELENNNLQKFIDKWGQKPEFDEFGMVKGIDRDER